MRLGTAKLNDVVTMEAIEEKATSQVALDGINLTLGYQERVVSKNLNVAIPPKSFTVIVGANACGKSTLLKSLARILKPKHGNVFLAGEVISKMPTKEVARKLGFMAQDASCPSGVSVSDLVARGRHPHRKFLQSWTSADEAALQQALAWTNTTDLANRNVDELSGGQKQRVWLAMVLAQQTDLLLLDEPTTFLDIAHQIEMLDLCAELNEAQQTTVVAVLHDLNHACRYATHLIAMKDGQIKYQGPPSEVITVQSVEEIFGLKCRVIQDPVSLTPLVIPLGGKVSAVAQF